jgi:putative aldouronate transport system permease protein
MTATTTPLPVPAAKPPRRRKTQRPPWEEKPTPGGQTSKGLVLLLVVALITVPLYSIVLTSLSTQESINVAGGLVLVPHGFTVEAYREIFTNQLIMHSIVVSVLITTIGTLLSMTVTILCAYGLSRSRSFGHRPILMVLVVTLFFGGGIIPTFLLVSVFNIIVMRGFFSNTAQDLIDAARIDGAGDWRILWAVVLPTSKAVVAVITLFYAVGYWNSFFNALLYLPDNSKWPLQMIIYTYTLQGNTMPGTGTGGGADFGHQPVAALSLQMAVVTLTLLPIIIAYPFAQRSFAKGMLIGAIKG